MNWQAKWIWVKEQSGNSDCYIYARREFDLERVSEAELHIACCYEYKLYINGHYAGRGSANKGASCQAFDRYAINRYLRPGPNVIGAICRNLEQGKPGGLLIQLNASGSDEPIVMTDHTWRVKLACDWGCSADGYLETYDSRLKPVGWNVVGFGESGWEEPEVLAEAGSCIGGTLTPRLIPKLHETELLAAELNAATDTVKAPRNLLQSSGGHATISPGSDASITLDFGRELTGIPGFRVLDGGVASVDIVYSEALDRNGNPAPSSQADRVILHGGRQEWQAFGRRTFRYIRLTFSEVGSVVLLGGVSVRATGYHARQVWEFECSDYTLNEVYKFGAHTLAVCMQDSYERDPLHDPVSYPTDARIQALGNHYAFGDLALASSDLQSYALRLIDGTGRPLAPEQVLSWVLMLHDHYLNTGNHMLIEDLYSHLREALSTHLNPRETENGLLADSSGTELAAWNAPYYQALRSASKLALALEEFEDARVWHAKATAVRNAFNSHFWNEELSCHTATCVDGVPGEVASARANVLAVAFDLADTTRYDAIRGLILANARRLGPGFSFYTLEAMARMDMVNEALDLIRSGWGAMLDRGATTCWSRFPDEHDESRLPASLCRGRCAAPTAFLAAEVLGIKPLLPEDSVSVIQPKPGGLEWARGGYNMRDSQLSLEWRMHEGEFTIEIDGPDGFIVAIPIGMFAHPVIHEIDLTPETPERRARKTYGWGDVIWRGGVERDPYLDWLKTQEAEPPAHYESKSRCDTNGQYVWVRQTVSTQVRYVVHEE